MRAPPAVCVALVLCASQALGQTATHAPVTTNAPPPAIETDAKKWSFSATVYTYLVPDSRDYAQPTVTADRGWLHLEARYNYEALETGSADQAQPFAWYNRLLFAATQKSRWVTLKLRCPVSKTHRIAPWRNPASARDATPIWKRP